MRTNVYDDLENHKTGLSIDQVNYEDQTQDTGEHDDHLNRVMPVIHKVMGSNITNLTR